MNACDHVAMMQRRRIFHDTAVADRYLKIFLVDSRAEHLRQHERLTQADRNLDRATRTDKMKTITTHCINGQFTESHGKEIFNLINPTNKTVIGCVPLGDEEDARDAIRAAKQAFTSRPIGTRLWESTDAICGSCTTLLRRGRTYISRSWPRSMAILPR
jgi:hypothetical protein